MDVYEDFEGIYRRHYLTVYRLAMAKCGGKTENAKDVFGEVFFQLLKHLKKGKTFNDINHEKAWLIRVTVNCSKVILRTYSTAKSEELSEQQFYSMMNNDGNEVYEAVMSLPEKYRIAIHLFYYDGYSIKEIAAILKTKENTVKSQLSRARKMLKEKLSKNPEFSHLDRKESAV